MVGETLQVLRVVNKTPPTIRLEPIAPKIHVQAETQYHTNNNYANVNLTGRSADVVPPLHRYPTLIIFLESDNNINTVTQDEMFLS